MTQIVLPMARRCRTSVRWLSGCPDRSPAADDAATFMFPVIRIDSPGATSDEPAINETEVDSDRQVETRSSGDSSAYSSCRRPTSHRPNACWFQPVLGRDRAAYW